MAFILTDKHGNVTKIDGKTGEIVSVNEGRQDLVEVESMLDHQNSQGNLCIGPRGGNRGARYFEPTLRAMDLVHRGVVKLVEPEVKMAEPEAAEVSAPVEAQKEDSKKVAKKK